MRRVHLKYGLKQRINDIIGTDNDNETIPSLTPWSVQAAIMSNLHRTVSGIVGESTRGRIMSGLQLTYVSPTKATIQAGCGFTNSGNVIVLAKSFDITLPVTALTYYYLKHTMAVLPHDQSGGKETEFVNQSASKEIVYDDAVTIAGSSATYNNSILALGTEIPEGHALYNDVTYIGNIEGTSVTPSTDRGFLFGSSFDNEMTFNANAVFSGASRVIAQGSGIHDFTNLRVGTLLLATSESLFTGSIAYKNGSGADATIHVKNGLIYTP